MDMELLRDVVIVISGIVITLAAILATFFLYSVYRKINDILKSTKATATKIEALTIVASDQLGKPVIQAASLVQGIIYGIQAMSKIFKKGG